MKTIIEITAKLQQIKRLIGLDLKPCDYFTGIQKSFNGYNYFNIVLDRRTSESIEYNKLLLLAKTGIISKVEPNGINRLAIFF